ncbi:MAG: type II toxin-antitoxin system PemK/MazF family toxin [Gemmatimonadetes bacterium]|nr:type II toxin-antitoxin system PemK/MazF family toxin [Gemmatimonadota bacterium]
MGLVSGAPRRGDVFLVSLAPTAERESGKTRPCLVVSPDELNLHLGTFTLAPMTTGGRPYPFRVSCRFEGKDGYIVLDQFRTVDRGRLVKRLGRISPAALSKVLRVLQEMFAE